MSPQPMTISRDVQLDTDDRQVAIREVGISDVKYPITVSGVELDESASQTVNATCSLAVSLQQELKGIHMSRLVEDLLENGGNIDFARVVALLARLREHQEARDAHLGFTFDYFLDRQAPVSGRIAKQSYACSYEGRLVGDQLVFLQKVTVPVTTLCPCSKEISSYGAHNQRGYVEVTLEHEFDALDRARVNICLEEVIEQVEACASAPLYPILKRVDERFVTMQAYDAPRFVEDMVRNVAVKLRGDGRMDRWTVRVTNHESIHQHNAYAVVRGGFGDS